MNYRCLCLSRSSSLFYYLYLCFCALPSTTQNTLTYWNIDQKIVINLYKNEIYTFLYILYNCMHTENKIYYFYTVKLSIWNVWAFFKTMFRLEISFYLDVTAGWTAETQTSVLQNSKKYEPYLNKSVKKGKIRFIDSKLKYKIQRIRKINLIDITLNLDHTNIAYICSTNSKFVNFNLHYTNITYMCYSVLSTNL